MARKFVSTINAPIVETKNGKLRGFQLDGINIFQGIQYADADRWQAPKPVEPWEGIKNATNYGYICPVIGNPAPSSEIFIPHRFWPANEHCQYLNIWTPGINDGKKRPVMVWLHGGGFADGSGIEQVAYEGDNLAQYGDVVVVTINHRLNILGYFDMSSFGEKYANSVNAGMADIVASLQWVHDNIEGFGGDPDNVTIFGQSGGGGKVQALLQIPAAAGLFHRAIIQSGVVPQKSIAKKPDHRQIALGMLKALGLTEDQVEEMETVPYDVLIRAYEKSCAELDTLISWNPVANEYYVGDPREVGFTDYAKTVPTIIGSTIAELAIRDVEKINSMTPEEQSAYITAKFGDKTQGILDELHKAFPGKRDTVATGIDTMFRVATVDYAEKKAAASTAPTYLYNFALDFPVMGGAYAWHCSDIPFVFHNSERVPNCNIEGVTERIEDQMSGAWVSFAYSGNPNHEGLPKWEEVGEKTYTMVFDDNSRCVADVDTELLNKIVEATDAPVFTPAPRKTNGSEKSREWMY
jgi:para-nitrobenzyl esterase